MSSKVLLIILDGFGRGKNYPFNAIQNAKMPFYRSIEKNFAMSQLLTSGEAVGLPAGVMGNSEVGHTNMGAGRVVYQELTRISKSIRDGEFSKNKAILNLIAQVKKTKGRLHLMGLLSDAGVHSHLGHLDAILALAAPQVPVTVHVFTDGRDTPPFSSEKYLRQLLKTLEAYPGSNIGSIGGRFYGMDRDNRWERVEKAWRAITGRMPTFANPDPQAGDPDALAALKKSFDASVTDEFVIPVHLASKEGRTTVEDGDGVFFFNFRSDRARELTRAFAVADFKDFNIQPRIKLAGYLCLTDYDKNLQLPVAFPPQSLTELFPDILARQKLKQFRIAETEKYAHVTFFFNGGREQIYAGEERKLIASPTDVATYDLKPEMSAPEVTRSLVARLEQGVDDFVLVNYANPDMVGHTGNYEAAIKALVCVDQCLEKVVSAALGSGYEILITADHGNIEEMCDDQDRPHTQHTLNPVPLHLISKKNTYQLQDGVLADIAPTMLKLLGLPQPKEMTGRSLIR